MEIWQRETSVHLDTEEHLGWALKPRYVLEPISWAPPECRAVLCNEVLQHSALHLEIGIHEKERQYSPKPGSA